MRSISILALGLFVVGVVGVVCAEPEAKPALKIKKISTGYQFTEGPAVGPKGQIYFTDIPNQLIYRFDPKTGKSKLYREDSGKANGLMFDSSGKLVVCEGGRRQLVRLDGEKSRTLCKTFDGKKLNSPNDVTIDQGGGIYFTDPRYGSQRGRELDFEGVFYRTAHGVVSRVATEVVKPNGIVLAKDGKTLYVADSSRKLLMAYDLEEFGKPTKGRIFGRLDEDWRGGPDGLSCDKAGNVYCAGQGKIWIFNAHGRFQEYLEMPEKPTNVVCVEKPAWTLYVTARTSLYQVTRPAPAKEAAPK